MESVKINTKDGAPGPELQDGQRSLKPGTRQPTAQPPVPMISTDSKRIAHYPLDIPLPFERYNHRRLGARDIMVHRIMSDLMRPTRVSDSIYDTPLYGSSALHQSEYENYELGKDLQVVQKTLFTSHADDTPDRSRRNPVATGRFTENCVLTDRFDENSVAVPESADGGTIVAPATYGSHVLDLVQRYYFETDNATLRLLIERLRPPRRPIVPKYIRDGLTRWSPRQAVVVEFDLIVAYQRLEQNKAWFNDDIEHLKGFRDQVSRQDNFPLYDGGSFLPSMRRPMDRDANGQRGSRPGRNHLHWALTSYRSPRDPPFSQPVQRRDVNRLITRAGCFSSVAHQPDDYDKPRERPSRQRRRPTSEPPPGSFAGAFLPHFGTESTADRPLNIMFPRMTLSQLDRRSRRRSLSRSRIAEMFDWQLDLTQIERGTPERGRAAASGSHNATDQGTQPVPGMSASTRKKHKTSGPCNNCGETSHTILACTAPCGHCGAPNPRKVQPPPRPPKVRKQYPSRTAPEYDSDSSSSTSSNGESTRARHPPRGIGKHGNHHLAPDCPVPRTSRCKCVAFPTYHVASRCTVRCARACGNTAPRGSFNHRNAMTCRSRCCMCGLAGHSGRDCRLRRCRCGGAHLGQDCGWKVECPRSGCPRFRCGMHCQDCGEAARPFVGGRCAACRGEVGEVVQEGDTKAPKGKTRRGKTRKSSGPRKGKDPSPDEKRLPPPKTGRDDQPQKGHRSLFGPQR